MEFQYPSDDEGIKTSALFRRRVGHEIEISDEGEFTDWLLTNDLAVGVHSPGCPCLGAATRPIHIVSDCTASGNEHHVGGVNGVLYGSPAYMTALDAVAAAAKATGSSGNSRVGGHIHVSKNGMSPGEVWLTYRNAVILWDQILVLASGRWSDVRRNQHMMANPQIPTPQGLRTDGGWGHMNIVDPISNLEAITNPGGPGSGTFNNQRGSKPTIEWRVWNTTTSKWRLYMSAGVSGAFMEAAVQRRVAEEGQDLLDHLSGLLTGDQVGLVERQRAIVKGDFSWAA